MNPVLRTLDLAVIIVYLLGVVMLGWYFARRNNSTEEYFVGSRSYPGWVLGLAMLSTTISSFTFLALPSITYSLDWRQAIPNLLYPIPAVFAIFFIIPFFRKMNFTSGFEYLEYRFNPVIRGYAAWGFLLTSCVGMGGIIYMVALPIAMLTGFSVPLIIVVFSLVIGVFTLIGGIDAVIWTDVIQGIILLLGGILAMVVIWQGIPGGLGQFMDIAAEHKKFSFGEMDFNLNERTFFTILIMGVWSWVGSFVSPQFVQKVAAAKSTREAQKALGISIGFCIPTWLLFLTIGTSLFVYYQINPDAALNGVKPDSVFPYFIMKQMPPVITGIVIAGALSAAMSTIDAAVNSFSAVAVTDVLRRHLAKGRSDRYYLNAGKICVAIYTVMMIMGGLFFHWYASETAIDFIWTVGSFIGGCMAAIFMIGFFTRRVNGKAALIALVLTLIFNGYLILGEMKLCPDWARLCIHPYIVGLAINLFFVAAALLASAFCKEQPKDLSGLTIWTLRDDYADSTKL